MSDEYTCCSNSPKYRSDLEHRTYMVLHCGAVSEVISSLDDMNSNTTSHNDPTVNMDVVEAEDRYRRADS
jgi:hypothetical protein